MLYCLSLELSLPSETNLAVMLERLILLLLLLLVELAAFIF